MWERPWTIWRQSSWRGGVDEWRSEVVSVQRKEQDEEVREKDERVRHSLNIVGDCLWCCHTVIILPLSSFPNPSLPPSQSLTSFSHLSLFPLKAAYCFCFALQLFFPPHPRPVIFLSEQLWYFIFSCVCKCCFHFWKTFCYNFKIAVIKPIERSKTVKKKKTFSLSLCSTLLPVNPGIALQNTLVSVYK